MVGKTGSPHPSHSHFENLTGEGVPHSGHGRYRNEQLMSTRSIKIAGRSIEPHVSHGSRSSGTRICRHARWYTYLLESSAAAGCSARPSHVVASLPFYVCRHHRQANPPGCDVWHFGQVGAFTLMRAPHSLQDLSSASFICTIIE